MIGGPPIAAMAQTLVDHGIDLTDDRAVILCLVAARYGDIEANLDAAIAFARRIHDARETLQLDPTLRRLAAIMRSG